MCIWLFSFRWKWTGRNNLTMSSIRRFIWIIHCVGFLAALCTLRNVITRNTHGISPILRFWFWIAIFAISAPKNLIKFQPFCVKIQHMDRDTVTLQETAIRYKKTSQFDKNKHLFSNLKKLRQYGVNSALSAYFFGPNRDQKLTMDKFLEFQKQMNEDILTLEVKHQIYSLITMVLSFFKLTSFAGKGYVKMPSSLKLISLKCCWLILLDIRVRGRFVW